MGSCRHIEDARCRSSRKYTGIPRLRPRFRIIRGACSKKSRFREHRFPRSWLISSKGRKSKNKSMQKIPAYNWSVLGQSLLDIAIKVGVGAVILFVNSVSASLTNGAIQLPYEAFSLPLVTLLLSQFDSYFVNWSGAKQS